ncbi:zf-TFIIB domain-containing protein [Candidatus Omnitrophota bacterium]
MYSNTCVRCKKKIGTKTRLCPHCNMPNKIPSTKTKALCPKCKVELEPKIYRKQELDVCPSCSGIWLDTLEFEYLTTEKDVYNDPTIEPIFVREALGERDKYRECVRCNNLMNRFNFKNISGILIDICCDHGAWLDAGELRRMRTFIASGGLDKRQDLEILKHKGKIKKLSDRLGDVEYMQKVLHVWSPKRLILGGGKF